MYKVPRKLTLIKETVDTSYNVLSLVFFFFIVIICGCLFLCNNFFFIFYTEELSIFSAFTTDLVVS